LGRKFSLISCEQGSALHNAVDLSAGCATCCIVLASRTAWTKGRHGNELSTN